MILGQGLLGQSFQSHAAAIPPDVVVIARGVSDSMENRDAAFEREWHTLKETVLGAPPTKRFVYFSTSRLDHGLAPDDRPYFHHKCAVEKWLLSVCRERVLIVRLPHLVGNGGHPNTAFNYLWRSVCTQEPFVVYAGGERRELLDAAEVAPAVCAHLKAQRHGVLRLRGYAFEITDIVGAMQKHLHQLNGQKTADSLEICAPLQKLLERYAQPNTHDSHRGSGFLSGR